MSGTRGKANPAYGSGIFRRRLRYRVDTLCVEVELEDCNHAFFLRLRHDGQQVVGLDAEPRRHPFVTCAEAPVPLRGLIGTPLNADTAGLRKRIPPGDNCTHLHDMALLALAHVATPGLERLYDIAVCDERDGMTAARIDCDGVKVHDWEIRAHTVTMPQEYSGKPMMRGFYDWVSACFAGMPLEAAVALQRGYFVAQARRIDRKPAEEFPASVDKMPDGSCYSYNHNVVARAVRIEGTVWDLTNKPELLLQFRRQS